MSVAEQRLEQLVGTHGARVLGYLVRRTDPREDAADVYAQVLAITWRRLRVVPRDDDEALAWMIGVARRCLANHRRGAVRRLALADRLRDDLRTECREPDAAARERAEALLDRLGAEDRELVTLVYWEGLTSDQVAAVLGCSASAARKRLQRARETMRTEEPAR